MTLPFRDRVLPSREEQVAERIRAAACEVARLQNRSLSDWLYRVVLDYAAERAIPPTNLSDGQMVEAVSSRLESLCRHIFDIDLHALRASGTSVAFLHLDETAQPERHLLDRAIGHLMARAPDEAVSPAAQASAGPARRTTASRPTRIDSRQIGPAIAAAVKRHKERGATGEAGDDLLSLCDEIAGTLGAYRARRQRVRESQSPPPPPRSEPRGERHVLRHPAPSVDAELRPSLAGSAGDSAARLDQPQPLPPRSSAPAVEEIPIAETHAVLGRLQRQYEDLSVGFSSIRDIHSRVATLDESVKGFMERDERRASELEARAAASAQQALEKVLAMLQAPRVSDEHSGLLRRTVDILDNLTERVDDTARRMSVLESRLAEPRAGGPATKPGGRPNIKVEPIREPRHSPARASATPSRPLKSDGAGTVRKPSTAVGVGDPAARARPHAHLGWSLGMGLAATAVAVGGAAYMGQPQVLADAPVAALKALDPHAAPDEVHSAAGESQAGQRSGPAAASTEPSRPDEAAAIGLEHQDAARAAALFDEGKGYEAGRGVTRDEGRAVALFQEAAELGSGEAQFHLGSLYERGIGVPRDLVRARALYRQAANGGHAGAMHNLAVLLFSGDSAADLPAALSWFQRAAQAGIRDSQYNLGVLYSQGRGVPRSLSEAYRWFALAAAQGDTEAAKKRDIVAAQLSPLDLRAARDRVAAFAPDARGVVAAVAN